MPKNSTGKDKVEQPNRTRSRRSNPSKSAAVSNNSVDDEGFRGFDFYEWVTEGSEDCYFFQSTNASADGRLQPDDMVVVDRQKTPKRGDLVAIQTNNGYVIKIYDPPVLFSLAAKNGKRVGAAKTYGKETNDGTVFGVVTRRITKF